MPPTHDVVRTTASATYYRLLRPQSIWASTAPWGRNDERGHDPTNAVLAETNVTGLSAGFVPETLVPFYGRRVNPGVALFVTPRPLTQTNQT